MAIEKSSVFAFAARTVRTREARTLTGTFLKAGLLVFLLSPALAQTTDLDALNAAVKSAQSAGDNAWMLMSAALVLMMTGPGLALFYGGLVRKKNVLGTMMQSFVLMAIITVLWAAGGLQPGIRNGTSFRWRLSILFLHGVGSSPNADYAATIPHQTFMVYQLMFAIITPALITGAFAERMKFSAMRLVHCTVGPVRVFSDGAHGVGQGRPAERLPGGKHPLLRFRGRHGCAYHVGRFGAGLRPLSGKARGVSHRP